MRCDKGSFTAENHTQAKSEAEACRLMRGIPERAHGQQHEREHEQDESEHGVPPAELDAVLEVLAMQFAGDMSIARLVPDWERDREWVENAMRRRMLEG